MLQSTHRGCPQILTAGGSIKGGHLECLALHEHPYQHSMFPPRSPSCPLTSLSLWDTVVRLRRHRALVFASSLSMYALSNALVAVTRRRRLPRCESIQSIRLSTINLTCILST